MGFFRQEYWSGLPFPTAGNLPKPGIGPVSLVSPALTGGSWVLEPPIKPPSKNIKWPEVGSVCEPVEGCLFLENKADKNSRWIQVWCQGSPCYQNSKLQRATDLNKQDEDRAIYINIHT